MKKPWLVACALFAVMATAMAADTTPAKPLSVAPIIITPEEKAKAEAARALAKIRANDARKRLLAKRQKEIDRKPAQTTGQRLKPRLPLQQRPP